MICHDLSLAVSKDIVLKTGNWTNLVFCAKLPLLMYRKYRGIKIKRKKENRRKEDHVCLYFLIENRAPSIVLVATPLRLLHQSAQLPRVL